MVVRGPLGGSILSVYAANGFDPKFVADFTVEGDYFRVAGNDATFSDAFTSDSEAGGLVVQKDSSGNAVWGAHNLLVQSEDFSAANWATINATITTNTVTAPDGTSTADTLTDNATNAHHYVEDPDVYTTDGNQRTWLLCVKAGTARYIALTSYEINTTAGNTSRIIFDTQSGVYTETGTKTDATLTPTDLGDGWWLIGFRSSEANGNYSGFRVEMNIDGTSSGASYIGSGDTMYIWGGAIYRSDLGGMADVPSDERGLSTDTTYVPTTTAARYLLRRGHYDYDGSTYNRTCLHEPEGATNECLDSRDPTAGTWGAVGSPGPVRDETGIDEVANTATTVTDNNVGGFEAILQNITIPDDSNPVAWSFFIKKNASPSNYPGPALNLFNGTTQLFYQITFDPSDGSYVTRSASGVTAPDSVLVENWSSVFWRVTLVGANNGTGNTQVSPTLYAAVNSDGSATWTNSVTGIVVTDQWDVVLNASIPSSPIITAGSAVTRSADTMKGKAASLPYSSTAISMAMKGRYGIDASVLQEFFSWWDDPSNLLRALNNNGDLLGRMETGGGRADSTESSAFTGGIAIDQRVALRAVGSSAVQVARNGTAAIADTSSVPAIPPISSSDLKVSTSGSVTLPLNGQVDTIRLWDEDVETAGIEEATA